MCVCTRWIVTLLDIIHQAYLSHFGALSTGKTELAAHDSKEKAQFAPGFPTIRDLGVAPLYHGNPSR
jgi:hypothetical protein